MNIWLWLALMPVSWTVGCTTGWLISYRFMFGKNVAPFNWRIAFPWMYRNWVCRRMT